MPYIGRISYSLYLWHWPLFSFSILIPIIFYLEKNFGIIYMRLFKLLILIPLSFIFAILSYRFIEYPLRKVKDFKKVFYIFCILIFVSLFGLLIYLKQGLPNRKFRLYELKIENSQDLMPYSSKNDNCLFLIKNLTGKYPKFDYCLANTKANDFDILILGDSHSSNLYYGFKKYFGDKIRYLELGIPSWPATFMLAEENLKEALNTKEKIKNLFNVLKKLKFKSVIIVTRNIVYYNGEDVDTITKKIFLNCFINRTCDNKKIYLSEIYKTIRYLKSLGVSKIYFLFENPVLNFNPIFSAVNYKFPFKFLNLNETKISFIDFYKREKEFRENIRRTLYKENVEFLNTDPVFCDSKYCYAIKNKKILYCDDDHISKYGAYLVTKFLDNIYNITKDFQSL